MWKHLPKHFVGLAPMDGVSDEIYRELMKEYGADVLVTEFVPAEGMARNAVKVLDHLIFTQEQRPILAQLFGNDPRSFYISTIICCHLGYDGVDINMGCPAKNVSQRGAGAGLIWNYDLASEIILAVQAGVSDYETGRCTLHDLGLRQKMLDAIVAKEMPRPKDALGVSVSVKTRIGIDTNIVDEWVPFLLAHDLDALAMHGRTLKQMYTGNADWQAISKAASYARQSGTVFMGNGDIQTKAQAKEVCENYAIDGVLIGRASFGNPWLFSGEDPNFEERIRLAIHHAYMYERLRPMAPFYPMRKHLSWYTKGVPGAREVRPELMQAHSAKEAKDILEVLRK